LSSNSEGRLIAPSARSECLDEIDGGPNCSVYSERSRQRQGKAGEGKGRDPALNAGSRCPPAAGHRARAIPRKSSNVKLFHEISGHESKICYFSASYCAKRINYSIQGLT
jgi:hypothetical protein